MGVVTRWRTSAGGAVSPSHARRGHRASIAEGIARLGNTLSSFEVGHAERDDAIAVHVSKTQYVLFWLLILAARCCCIAFLACTARLYWFVAHPYMSYYASLLGPMAAAQLRPVGVAFGLVGLAHMHEVGQMFLSSIRARRLVFESPPNSAQVAPISASLRTPGCRIFSVLSFVLTRLRQCFDRRGFFGVESDFFHARFVFRELVEIVSQTWQVYNSSVLIAKVWINNFYVSISLINCCSTPILQFLFHKKPPLERLLCLCCDFVLDAMMSIVMPMIIFTPYYKKFDVSMYNFEISYLYDDIWFANMVMENQQIFVQTKWDFVWTIVPHLSMYSCLGSLKALIRPQRQRGRLRSTSSSRTTISLAPQPHCLVEQYSQLSMISERSVAPTPDDYRTAPEDPRKPEYSDASQTTLSRPSPDLRTKSERSDVTSRNPFSIKSVFPGKSEQLEGSHNVSPVEPQKPSRSRRRVRRKLVNRGGLALKAVNVGLVLWGFGILTLHLLALRASRTAAVPGCKQQTRPWFATNISCSVLQYNCHQYNVSDVREADLEILQEESVVALVISHCPQLHVPKQVQNFRNLLGIDIFNSTLYAWNQDAAITNTTHPRLAYIIFVRVNMTQLPEGVLQTLPDSMTDFEISVTNLTHLPDDLHTRWSPMSIFYVEHSLITEFPPTLLHLAVDDLSLIGSSIDQLPRIPDDHRGFFTLAMTHTPLESLPDSLGSLTNLGFLNLGYTKLKDFPSWMDSLKKTATKIYVHHTPFCDSKLEDERAEEYGDNAVLTCSAVGDRQDGKYPLALMAPRRLYDPPK